tara:strand:+ start:1765 stop:2865 length:1101 start_codon:yes stop_codon:yes gene_type:complete
MATAKQNKRNFNPMSLAFLDVMSCGFGAVVLIFLILDHSTQNATNVADPTLAAEISLLDEQILEGEEGLVRVRNTLSEVDLQIVVAQGRARAIEEEIDNFMDRLLNLEENNSSGEDEIMRLQQEIASLEAELERLREAEDQFTGNNIRRFVGDGNRQYLTGLILGGNRILLLVDISSSMLDDTIVNIIRRRNMSDEAKLNSEKWRSVQGTVDWLTTQLPIPSQYQIYTFSEEVDSLIPGTQGQWLEVADDEQLNQAVVAMHETIPDGGTNLARLFQSIQGLTPLPDNIFLITDGLPTRDNRTPRTATISGRDRERLFEQALDYLPSGIPVNVILAPLEGDPLAAAYYWQLAIATGGAFMSPSRDWP